MSWRGTPVECLVWTAGLFNRSGSDPRSRAPREILVLRPNDLDDLLTTTPIFQALKERFPKTKIVAGIGSWGCPVLANNPFVDEIVEIDAPWNNKFVQDQSWGAVWNFLTRSPQISKQLLRGGFDAGIDVMGSHVGAALMMRLGVRYRVGVRGYRGGWSGCQQYIRFSDVVHVAKAALAQAERMGAISVPEPRPQIYLTKAERVDALRIWKADSSKGHRILVGCGGGLGEKCWPPESFGKALREISAAIMAESIVPNIILIGGPKDRQRGAEIVKNGPANLRDLCGDVSLRQTFAIAEQADLVLTNPSMLLHAAASFKRPTVVVLGGMYANPTEHDRLWGYPPPYKSVGPINPAKWPSVSQIAKVATEEIRLLHSFPAPERS